MLTLYFYTVLLDEQGTPGGIFQNPQQKARYGARGLCGRESQGLPSGDLDERCGIHRVYRRQ